MSSAIYLNHLRNTGMLNHNPYYEFFRDSIGKGDNQYKTYRSGIGDFVRIAPDFRRGYGILSRDDDYDGRYQLGSGFGSFFGRLFRFSKPLLRRGLQEALAIGTNVAKDVLDGANVKASLKSNVKKRVTETLPPHVATLVNKSIGSGKRKRSSRHLVERSRHKQKKVKLNYPALKLIP